MLLEQRVNWCKLWGCLRSESLVMMRKVCAQVFCFLMFSRNRSMLKGPSPYGIGKIPRLCILSIRLLSHYPFATIKVDDCTYPLVNWHSYGKSPSLIAKSTINGPFSIAMFNYQRVWILEDQGWFDRMWFCVVINHENVVNPRIHHPQRGMNLGIPLFGMISAPKWLVNGMVLGFTAWSMVYSNCCWGRYPTAYMWATMPTIAKRFSFVNSYHSASWFWLCHGISMIDMSDYNWLSSQSCNW